MSLPKRINILFYFASALLVGVHFFVILSYSVNVPAMDDFDAIIGFLLKFREAQLFNKFKLIFERHNEHHIILVRLISIVMSLFGPINMIHFIILGNIILVSIPFLIVFTQDFSNKGVLLLLSLFLVLNFGSFENNFWAMASMQNYGIILLSVLTIIVLDNTDKRFIIAVFLSFLSVFSSGNGFLVLFLALFIMILEKYRKVYIYAWSVWSVFLLVLLFYNYEHPAYHPSVTDTIANKMHILIPHYLVIVGNHLNNLAIKIIAGILLLLAIFFVLLQGRIHINVRLKSILFFLLLSCALVSLSRAGFGVNQATAPRYFIYSSLIIFVVYVILNLEFLRNVKLKNAFAIAALCLGALLYIYNLKKIDKIKYVKGRLVHAAAIASIPGLTAHFYPSQEIAEKVVSEAQEAGVYSLPVISDYDFTNLEYNKWKDSINYEIELKSVEDSIFFEGSVFVNGVHSRNVDVTLTLIGQSNQMSLRTLKSFNWTNFLVEGYHYGSSGFVSEKVKLDNVDFCSSGSVIISVNVNDNRFKDISVDQCTFTERQK